MKSVYFQPGLTVQLFDMVGSGHSRNVHACNHTTAEGKTYVIKIAKDGKDSELSNLLEYHLYQYCIKYNGRIAHMLPEFKAISPCNRYLLVESCITAGKAHSESDSRQHMSRLRDKYFDEALLIDMHEDNWGYTDFDERPVIMDVGFHSERHISSLSQHVGFPDEAVDTILSGFNKTRVQPSCGRQENAMFDAMIELRNNMHERPIFIGGTINFLKPRKVEVVWDKAHKEAKEFIKPKHDHKTAWPKPAHEIRRMQEHKEELIKAMQLNMRVPSHLIKANVI